MKILVVDDAMFMRKILKDMITHLGHEVIEAKDGEEAVAKSRLEQPDVVFMDVIMPKMDGITATKLLKNELNSKIIMCSAISDKKNIIRAIKAGARDYIIKPVDDARLKDALGRAIQSDYL